MLLESLVASQDPKEEALAHFHPETLGATAFNCRRQCHASEGLFLLAKAGGPIVDTHGYRWAAACGRGLVAIEEAPC